MSQIDFTKCKTGLDAVAKMFNHLFPTIEHVILDNEIILEDQATQMKMYATLHEEHKILKEKYEQLKTHVGEDVREEADGEAKEVQGDLFLQEGSGELAGVP
jgi:hypothetical protein